MDPVPLERLEVRNYSVSAEGDAFYISGQIMSVDLLPEAVLRANIKKLVGKEVRLEHAIVELEPYAMVGEVVDVWWDEKLNAPFAKSLIYNDTEIERTLRKDLIDDQKKPVAERKYKGFSIGILHSRDKTTRQSTKIFPRELTITSDPVCKECTVNYIGEYSMSLSPKDLDLIEEKFKKQTDQLKADYEKKMLEFSGAQETLTKKLSAAAKEVEDFKVQMQQKENEINSLKEGKRRAEVEPLVNGLLDVCQYSKTSDIFKAKKEKWMKLEKDVLVDFVDSMKYVVGLFSQTIPTVGGERSLPIENANADQSDRGVGLVTMPDKLARRIL